ncbi:MAG: hypothetical protein Q4B52_00155 [Tissierellia bacterium]|nr:hypothetical protein [Tissierellia bacterium]
MNDVLLIKKLKPDEDIDTIMPVRFIISGMDEKENILKLFGNLRKENILNDDKILVKIDGITINICPKDIDKVIKIIFSMGLSIYEIFTMYDN